MGSRGESVVAFAVQSVLIVVGLKLQVEGTASSSSGPAAGSSSHTPPLRLHIQTDLTEPLTPPPVPPKTIEPLPLIGEVISPSRLKLHHFGSRFLPHTTAPIRCLLPILGETLLLIGHDDGLSVLNMFPKEWTDSGLAEKGPNDAEAHPVWVGEGYAVQSTACVSRGC